MLLIRSHQPLEERLAEAGGSGLLAHDDGSELTVIANENDLLGAKNHRNHAFRFGCLKLRNEKGVKRKQFAAKLVVIIMWKKNIISLLIMSMDYFSIYKY